MAAGQAVDLLMRINVPSMRGSSPVWSIHADRVVGRGRTRFQAIARAVAPSSGAPAVGDLLGAAAGSPRVTGSAKRTSLPCFGGRPPRDGEIHGMGTGWRITRSVRIRPRNSAGVPTGHVDGVLDPAADLVGG